MFMITGNFGNDTESIYKSLREVAERDPVLVREKSSWSSHSDGWGIVSIGTSKIGHVRSSQPLFESGIPELINSGIMLMHARKASSGEPAGTLMSHPYVYSDNDYTVFLAHNGSLNKNVLAQKLGIDNVDHDTDSSVFLTYMMSNKGNVGERLQKAIKESRENDVFKKLTNLFVISVSKDDFKTQCFYYSHNVTDREYGKLYKVYGKGWTGIFSSSITEAKNFPAETEKNGVDYEKVLEMDCQARDQK